MQRKKIIPTYLSENLKRIRKASGLTQEQVTNRLAEMGMNITRQSYNRYENNNAGPDYSTLMMLADIFNTDVNTLVGYVPKSKESNGVEDKKEVSKLFFDVLNLDNRGFDWTFTEDLSHFTVDITPMGYTDSDGRIKLTSEGKLELTRNQFIKLQKLAKEEWDNNFPSYFLTCVRRVNDYINEKKDKRTVDMYFAERDAEKGIIFK